MCPKPPIMAFLPDDLSFQPHDEHHFVPNSHFHGTDVVLLKRSVSFSSTERCEDLHNSGEDELSDDGLHLVSGEKKRRLKLEQVKALEKSFDLGSKLEPERKLQLARATGLQPRQIAIWFQNRRARWKTKQLERDYSLLKKQFDAVKAHNDTLQAENHKLHAQLLALKSGEPNGAVAISLKREPKEDSWNVACGAEGDSDVDASRTRLFPPLPLRPAYVTFDHQHQGSSSADVAQYYTDIGNASQDGGFYGMIGGAEEGRQELWSWPELAHHFR